MTKISVIIPVYNTGKYLKECLDSIINQTLDDIEVICIDDGSTDSSLQILREYAQKDARIIVIQQENKGAGAARNRGLQIAKGEFINFFDSDDYMEPTTLQALYTRSIETNSDITICRSAYLKPNLTKTPINFSIEKDLIGEKTLLKPLEFSKYIFQFCVGWPWDKLYKYDFIKNNKLEFQNLRQSNDTYFVLSSLVFADKIAIVDKELIIHRIHQNSLEATRIKSPECFYYALKNLYDALVKNELFKTYEQSFINYCFTFSYWHINTINDKNAKNKMLDKFEMLYEELSMHKYKKDYFYNKKIYNKLRRKIQYKRLTKKLFSIKNNEHHKTITILGIKIQIK